ncbi:MAG: HesA/MoeB/ThiF family protein [Clostridium sp.]|nr:HesA/MoeB/ThiF family protein [Clostridium sp.]
MTNYQFRKDQLTRYRGHISLCEIDLPGQSAISSGRVLIVGAGGLGSPVALYLAAAGVGTIGVVDGDNVSLSNLQRQIAHGTDDVGRPKTESVAREMHRINPEVKIQTYNFFLTPDNASKIFSDYDLIIDCTDNFHTRLLISDTAVETGKPFIFGGVSRFSGQVFTHLPGTADLPAIFGREQPEDTRSCVQTGILNTVVGIVGSLQATEAVKFLTGTGDLLTDRLLVFDAITMDFAVFPVIKKD